MRFHSLLASYSLAVMLACGVAASSAAAQASTPPPSPLGAPTPTALPAPLATSGSTAMPAAMPTADSFAAILNLRAGHGKTTKTYRDLTALLRDSATIHGAAGGASGTTAVVCFTASSESSAAPDPSPTSTSTPTGEQILSDCGERPKFLAYLRVATLRSIAPSVDLAVLRDKAWSELGVRLGLDVTHLLAAIRRDPLFDGKAIAKAADGTVFMVTALSHDPPNSRYDHGFRTTIHHLYLFRDGRVAAVFLQYSEN